MIHHLHSYSVEMEIDYDANPGALTVYSEIRHTILLCGMESSPTCVRGGSQSEGASRRRALLLSQKNADQTELKLSTRRNHLSLDYRQF